MSKLLAGKVVAITGAATGIGRAIAIGMAEHGASVAINYLGPTQDEQIATLRSTIESTPISGSLLAVPGDISLPETSKTLISKTVEKYGKLDVFVSNAGVCQFADFLSLPKELYERTVRINLDGAFYATQAAANQMVVQGTGGSIIGVSSISALVGGAGQTHYTPTKAGVLSLMQSCAAALGIHGIRCNAILPGTIKTALNEEDLADEGKRKYMEGRIPLGRTGVPDDIAGPAVFLASDLSKYMTGAQLLVGGIYVPVPTFFVRKSTSTYNASNPSLDLEAQAAHSIHLAKSGCRGLVLLGSTGEAVHLTRSERTSQIKYVRKALLDAGFKDYPLIAGTATNGIEETVELLKDAKEAGAGWGLVLAPGYFAGAANQDGIIGWYEAVANSSPIPVMIYHYPGVSNNVKITPSTFRALAAHPNIVGGKLSHGDISVHSQIALDPLIDTDHFHLFTGLGQQLFPVLQVGCYGAIDGLAGIFPKSVVALYNLVTKDEPLDKERLQKIRALQYRVSAAEELIVSWGTVGIKEAVSRVLGFGDIDGGRLPLAKGMGEGEWSKWEPVMKEMERIEAGL